MPAIDQAGMRRVNTAATLRAITDHDGEMTLADLVSETRLSRRTVELILGELQESGRVVETIGAPEGVGRPKKLFELVPDHARVLAVVVVPPRITAVLADVRGRELARADAELDEGEAFADAVERAVGVARSIAGDASRLAGIVVGAGGPISEDGRVVTPPVNEGWRGADFATPFRDEFGAPTWVENDTNLMALAEAESGAARDAGTFAFLTPGSRVSAAIVIDGSLYRGFQGSAGELMRLKEVAAEWQSHPVAGVTSPDPSARAHARGILRAAGAGDDASRRLVGEFFGSVARLIAIFGWLLAPPVLVISGGFDGVEREARALLGESLAEVDVPAIDIRVVTQDPEGAVRGAVRLALQKADTAIYGARR